MEVDDGFTTVSRTSGNRQVAARAPVAATGAVTPAPIPVESPEEAMRRAIAMGVIHATRIQDGEGDDLATTLRRLCPSHWPAKPGKLVTPCLGTDTDECLYKHPDPCQAAACRVARVPGCTLLHVQDLGRGKRKKKKKKRKRKRKRKKHKEEEDTEEEKEKEEEEEE